MLTKQHYIPNELCDRSVYIPIFQRVRTSLVEPYSCCICNRDLGYYSGKSTRDYVFAANSKIYYQMLVVSIQSAQKNTSPNEVVFVVSVREGICLEDDIDNTLESPPKETANFSIFDSMDCYSIDTNKDLVSQHIRFTPPEKNVCRCVAIPDGVTYYPSDYKGKYKLDAYVKAFDVICGKILSGFGAQESKANPHMGKRKKRAKD